jgi:hypothetical protein
MILFENLEHLTIVTSSVDDYPPLLLDNLQSTNYFSSNLTVLRIYVYSFDECLILLDGRLKHLTTFIVQIRYIGPSCTARNMVSSDCLYLIESKEKIDDEMMFFALDNY